MQNIDFSTYVQMNIFHRGVKTGKGTKTDWAFCTKDNPCGAQQGDCDTDRECSQGLQCGRDNCKNFHADAHRLAD